MILAITSMGKDLKSGIDQRFGRAKYIILYNTDDSSFECHDNNLNLNAPQGAGIQTAQNIVDEGANVVITGNLGPKAFIVLNTANVKTFWSKDVTVEDAIQSYMNNELQELTNPNVQGHWS
ncbi:MAG: NifB/NifX family molybdenum-iron cluster-binding protein [bacterium]